MGKFWEDVKETAAAAARQGAKDLHNSIVPAFPTYVHGVDEPGTPLSPLKAEQPKPNFEQAVQRESERQHVIAAAREQDKGIEL